MINQLYMQYTTYTHDKKLTVMSYSFVSLSLHRLLREGIITFGFELLVHSWNVTLVYLIQLIVSFPPLQQQLALHGDYLGLYQ